jgi:hypothetical protein
VLYYNQPQYESVNCGDGGVYTYSVPSGSYLATSLAIANAAALLEAVDTANSQGFCLPYSPSLCLNSTADSSLLLSGGVGPFSWNIQSGTVPTGLTLDFTSSNYATLSGTPTVLGAYTFTLTVNDSIGGQLVKTVTVEIIGFTVAMSSTGSTGSDGTATATPSGTGTYTYLWSNGGTTQTITGLAPGSYDVTVTDTDTGCTATGSTTVAASLLMAVTGTTDETVVAGVGQSDGTVTLHITGGTGPYTVSCVQPYGPWAGAGPDIVATGLPGATDYDFQVQDSLGNLYPAAPPPYVTTHVYREAFSWTVAKSSTLAQLAGFPNSRAFSILQFDPADPVYLGGTLTSVDFQMDSLFRSPLSVTNTSGSPQTSTVIVSDVFTFVANSVTKVTQTLTLATFGPTVIAAGGTQPYAQRSASATNTSGADSSGSMLAACTGTGNIPNTTLNVAAVGVNITTGSGLVATVAGANNGGTATATYSYGAARQ